MTTGDTTPESAPQDWVTKGLYYVSMILLAATLVALTNSPMTWIQPIGRELCALYIGVLSTIIILRWNVPKQGPDTAEKRATSR